MQLAPRPPQLVGRDETVAELRERLRASDVRPEVVAVHGLGGVGKTSLTLEYAYRLQQEYDLVWQLPAAEPAVLSAAFARLAALMGLRELGADAADPVDQVHAALAARTLPWLLIFDNVPEAEALLPFLPPAGPGHVLVTSRSGRWPRDQGLELPVLDLVNAARLLLSSSGQDDEVAAAEAVSEFGALPLSLEQAAAYMSETGLALSEYLDLLHHQRTELLAQGQAWGYRERVASTWQFAFERLARTSPQAIALLRLLSCYAHEAIPYHLLLSPLERWAPRELFRADVQRRRAYGRIPGPPARLLRDVHPSVLVMMRALPRDTLRINAALTALRRHSLIGPPVDGAVTVHRLVQAVTLDQLSRRVQRRWREVAAVLVEAVLPDDPGQKARWPRYARLLPHIRTVLGPTSPGMDKTAQYLGASGDYRTARSLFQEIAAALAAALGPEEGATLTARHELALWTGEAGDPAAARDQYAALIPIRRWVSGPEHPDTLTTQANLAQWTGQAGDAAAARDQYATLLPVRERVQGPEHPSTLINRHELARWTGSWGTRRRLGSSMRRWCRYGSGFRGVNIPTPSPPGPISPTGQGGRGMRWGPGSCVRRWCRYGSGFRGVNIPTPSPPGPISPTGQGGRGMRWGPGSCVRRCCRFVPGCSGPGIRRRSPRGNSLPTGRPVPARKGEGPPQGPGRGAGARGGEPAPRAPAATGEGRGGRRRRRAPRRPRAG
nr:tetratricopeptide repeat protein [Nonomuraea sp. WAC 01424]